jgi:hypothetical protein
MSNKADGADGAKKRPTDLEERSDSPRIWDPWSFRKKRRDWHQLFYDGLASSAAARTVKHIFSNPNDISPADDGY